MKEISTNNPLIRYAFEIKNNIELGFVHLGKILKEIRDTKAWSNDYESFDNPEKHNLVEDLGLKKSSVNKIILIYEKFVEIGGIDENKISSIGWAKLAETTSLVKDKETAEEMLHLAEHAATLQDLRDNLREKRTGILQSECLCEDTYTITVCRTCNERTKI